MGQTCEMSDDLTGLAHATMPFAEHCGLRDVVGDETGVSGKADWAAERCTIGGALHGGFLMSAADTVGAMAAAMHLPPGAGTSTIESKTNFFRAVTSGEITIVSTPVHTGRSTIVIQTDITREDGKLVSRTTQTQAVLGG